MSEKAYLRKNRGQTAIEYLLLLATVVAIVLIGFKKYMPVFYDAADIYYNRVGVGIYGEPNRCGDNTLSAFENCATCPVDAGICP